MEYDKRFIQNVTSLFPDCVKAERLATDDRGKPHGRETLILRKADKPQCYVLEHWAYASDQDDIFSPREKETTLWDGSIVDENLGLFDQFGSYLVGKLGARLRTIEATKKRQEAKQ